MDYKDYYATLGVSKTASQDDIKKAFRKLARQYHPDIKPGDASAEAKFKEINEANDVLSDPEKRKKYDKLGSNWQSFSQTASRTASPRSSSRRTSGPSNTEFGAGFKNPGSSNEYFGDFAKDYSARFEKSSGSNFTGSFSDFYKTLFGFDESAKKFDEQAKKLSPDQTSPLIITLEEAFHGADKIITVGAHHIKLKIKPGMESGKKLKLAGKAKNGGDLLLHITVQEHDRFERRGNDLFVDVPISLTTAAFGGETDVTTIDGKKLKIKIAPETQSGVRLRLKNLGMPSLTKPTERGDLYARVMIHLPKPLTQEHKDILKKFSDQAEQ
jgi:curved DNA-binding protein